MSRGKLPHGVNLTPKHELCECGHCRCQHAGTFGKCHICICDRYTWPGPGSELPANHAKEEPRG